jgi:hypothetical protein
MTTPELHTLAKDPQAFDTTLAGLTDRQAAQVATAIMKSYQQNH